MLFVLQCLSLQRTQPERSRYQQLWGLLQTFVFGGDSFVSNQTSPVNNSGDWKILLPMEGSTFVLKLRSQYGRIAQPMLRRVKCAIFWPFSDEVWL